MEVLEASAVVHDIGILVAFQKHGKSLGRLQEIEGPAWAEKMLGKPGFTEEMIKRISYLVGHHHTYLNIVGTGYQILVETDFLVNLYKGKRDADAVKKA